MKRLSILFLIIVFLFSCSKDEVITDGGERFPILSYDAEISETLNLDTSKIFIDDSIKLNFWTQHFHGPTNDLNNIYTDADFSSKSKIIDGKSGLVNIIQPIYFNENICSVLSHGILKCINSVTKKEIFKIDVKPDDVKKYEVLRGGIAFFDEQIVFVDAYGQIRLFDASNGEEIWKNRIDYPILSPPLIYRGYIYFISADNRIFSIDISDGSISWSFQTISETTKNLFTSSPVAFENLIIVPFSNGELIAFIYDTGQPVWSENLAKVSPISNFDVKDISASPVISNNIIYSVGSNGRLVSLNAINGKRNWSMDLSGYRTPIISGDQVYIINDEGKLICIDEETSEIYWITDLSKYRKGKKAEDLNLWLGPYLINNLLYSISYFGEIKIVSPINGELLSKSSTGIKGVLVPPLVLSNSIFMIDENSNVYKFK